MRLRQAPVERRSLSESVIVRSVMETSAEAFVGVGTDGVIEDWSSSAEKLFGLRADDAVGRSLDKLVQRGAVSSPGPGFLADLLLHPPGGEDRVVVTTKALRADGSPCPVEVSLMRGSGPSGWSVRAFVRDVSERAALEEQLAHQDDPMTGLPIASALGKMIAAALERERPRNRLVAVCHLDVDRTQVVNDGLGHAAGDELLAALAQRLVAATRSPKGVVRYGGDEFVAVVDQIDGLESATRLATKIVKVMSNPVLVARREVFPSISLGVVLIDPTAPAEEPDTIVGNAVLATRRAKERGGSNWELFNPTMRSAALAQLELDVDLHHAIERDELRLRFQPIVTFEGEVVAYEALVRWQHPRLGLVGPAEFLMIAEETGLIVPVGAWVLRHAARQIAAWRVSAPGTRLAVNLSPRQLAERDLVAGVSSILEEEQLAPDALSIEVTETALLGGTGAAAATLSALANLGTSITLDDFGIGYASLLYLRRFPIEVVKLDRYFLAGIAKQGAGSAIVRPIVDLAHSLGMQVVAEGVETPSDVPVLAELGCDLLQGHLAAPPRPAEDVTPCLGKRLALDRAPEAPRASRVLDVPSAGAPHPGGASRGASAQVQPGVTVRVLIVEASQDERRRLRDALSASSALEVVGESSRADEALELALSTDPGIVLLDLSLTGDHGSDLLGELMRRAPGARVVVRTAFASPAVTRSLLASGADACLDALLDPEQVARELSELGPLDTPRPPAFLPSLTVGVAPHSDRSVGSVRRPDVLEPGRRLEEYVEMALAGRAQDAAQLALELRRAGADFDEIAEGLLAGAGRQLDERLLAGSISRAQRQVATSVAIACLDALSTVGAAPDHLGRVVLACAPDEADPVPGRMIAESLRLRGWQAAIVGPITPEDLVPLLAPRQFNALLVSCSVPMLLDDVSRMIEVAHESTTRLLATGPGFGEDASRADRLGVDGWAGDSKQAARVLNDWRTRRFDARTAGARLVAVGSSARAEGLQARKLALKSRALVEDDRYAEAVALVVRTAVAERLVGDEQVLSELSQRVRLLVRGERLNPTRLTDLVRGTTEQLVKQDERVAWLVERVKRALELAGYLEADRTAS